jgi:hypothetical protein
MWATTVQQSVHESVSSTMLVLIIYYVAYAVIYRISASSYCERNETDNKCGSIVCKLIVLSPETATQGIRLITIVFLHQNLNKDVLLISAGQRALFCICYIKRHSHAHHKQPAGHRIHGLNTWTHHELR